MRPYNHAWNWYVSVAFPPLSCSCIGSLFPYTAVYLKMRNVDQMSRIGFSVLRPSYSFV